MATIKNVVNNIKSNFIKDKKDDKDNKEVNNTSDIDVSNANFFRVGEYFPPVAHRERIDRYKRNRKLFKGEHFDVFKNYNGAKRNQDLLYVSVNLAGIIAKKSADFLFGEEVQIVAGNGNDSKEQIAFDRLFEDNDLNIKTYESALSNAYRGDSFFKVRYGQEYGGQLPIEVDKPRVIIDAVNPENVYPETSIYDANRIIAYHIAVPVEVVIDGQDRWQLFTESHYAGRIEYRVFNINPIEGRTYGTYKEVSTWKIENEVISAREIVNTGVAMPLVIHIPNFSTDDTWEGIDDLTEHLPVLEEINLRLTEISSIISKHSDPAMAIPSGLLGEDIDGNPIFNVARDKVFEVMGKDDIIPQYVTWEGQLAHAFAELDRLVELLLTTAEIPAVALGKGDAGTSGSSGLAIKFRMNSLLAKTNRKRTYYEKGLKQLYVTAQMLEKALGIADYEVTIPKLTFQDGLPTDAAEVATVMNIRTGGMKTLSQKTAIMRMENMTEAQAELEIERIREEEENAMIKFTDSSIFNEPKMGIKDLDKTDTSKHSEGNPVTDAADPKNPKVKPTGAKKPRTTKKKETKAAE